MSQNMLNLSNDDVCRCVINEKPSLGIEAENEITISYIQPKTPTTSHGGKLPTPSNATVISLYGHKLFPDSSSGLCSVPIEAPPGKVLSILFLEQTCSRDNHVKVDDLHDGWSTTLDGCSPWKSPGYDVTTANRSALVVIGLNNLVDFFRLRIQIWAVQNPSGVFTRYVSLVLGYIQTPGWHPFARPFSSYTSGTATVMVPMDHVTLISKVHYVVGCHTMYMYITTESKRTKKTRRECDCFTYCSYCVELLVDVYMFRVEMHEVHGHFFQGIRVLFSFHQSLLAPKQQSGRLWNCSVQSWPDFHQHFVCNNKRECVGREDEKWCPDTSCHQGGILLNEICYIVLRLPDGKQTWHHANTACKQRGAALASFPTVNSWYHLDILSRSEADHDFYFIGLHSPDTNLPHMYQFTLQWQDDSVCHYLLWEKYSEPPSCGVFTCTYAFLHSCMHLVQAAYALCQVVPSSIRNVLQKNVVDGNVFNRLTTQLHSNFRNIYREDFLFPSISCPDQHRTQTFLACDTYSACWHDYDQRSNRVNVTTDNAVKRSCLDIDTTSFKALYPCRNRASFVPYSLVCNFIQDCADNSDEDFCVFQPCSAALQYKCANGQCLQASQQCDGYAQCMDDSDEGDCVTGDLYHETSVQPLLASVRPPAVADFDGRGWIIYTPLTTVKKSSAMVCPDTHVFCPGDGYCLPVYVRCNGVHDCPGGEDEDSCNIYTCPGLYRCRGLLNTCLHPDHLCDGWSQCPQHDDELFCNMTCPVNCSCLGHALTCSGNFNVEIFSRLRYLDASGIGLKPERIVNNLMLVYLSLASCDLEYLDNLALPNLLSLNLDDNLFRVITVAELKMMENLQNISLARNPLSNIFPGNDSSDSSGFFAHKAILHVDVTGVELKVLDTRRDIPFPNLLSLNLSKSGVTRVVGDGFRSLSSLQILDLRGCPMSVFPRLIFKDLHDLHLVFTDNFKLCCEANLPVDFNMGGCHAPFNEISSCETLLRADVYRICLVILAVLALSGNLSCFSLRMFSRAGRSKTGFNVFVTHLCISDFMMGVYMTIVCVADRLYMGIYLWEESTWRHSAACKAAGVLALLSSEVSAFIICLITLDRFLAICFPFSRLRISSFSAQVVSVMIWTIGAVLVTVPLLPFAAFGYFYGQTGICVPLPVTRNDFPGRHYAFGVMILLNFAVFLLIAVGQVSVYLSMRSNAMSSTDMTRKSRDLIVARRLITVVVSDFLCWFPVGLLGVLASQDVPVSSEVNVVMAIFVLPLNSALNPFLYTLNMIQEKRQRATEAKLLKLIMNHRINDSNDLKKG